MRKKMKIVYAAGPGNVIGTFDHWHKGQDDPSQVSMTFSGQFFDVCSILDAEGYVIASPSEKKCLKADRFVIEHRPILLSKKSGALYYLGQILYELSIVISALRFKADVVIGNSTLCFFVLSLLPIFGIQVIPSLHCVLWPKYLSPSKTTKLLMQMNSHFFSKNCLAILSTSEDINEQVNQITNNQARPIVNFLSTYRRNEFAHVTPPSPDKSTFHVLFAGRIEVNKGVFDLLEVAQRFQAEGKNNIVFHICGVGSSLESLGQQVEEFGLGSSFKLHGYCNKPKMQEMFNLSHVVIVPTKSDFCEGLNQVVVEGVLANRPVITSSICPALSYVKEAVLEVPPDDAHAYGDAILNLLHDDKLYQEKQQNCKKVQEQFYSDAHSWRESLISILKALN
jgi:glycosyltransferase involved in cell wall biosynthesis